MTLSRRTILTGTLAAGAVAASPALAAPAAQVERWGVFEIALPGPAQGNPFDDVRVSGVFECDGRQVRAPGFYDPPPPCQAAHTHRETV